MIAVCGRMGLAGQRNRTPDSLARLADALERRGGELVELAEAGE